MSKPITPRLHGLIDYGFAAANLALPSLLHMTKGPKLVFGAFGLVQGTLNALTAQPVGLKKAVPFRMHGTIEKSSIPLYVIVPLLAKAQKNRRSLAWWITAGAALVAVYNLTDWDSPAPRS